MIEPTYQPTADFSVDFPESRPLTAEYFVDWLIEYKGLDPSHKVNVVSNLKRDYSRVELQGALKQAMKTPPVVVNLSLFGRKS